MSRYTLMDYFSIYVEEWDSLLEEFLRHLAMTSFSVVLALIIAVPLGIFITRNKAVSNVVIGIANVMQSIPCMALLAMGIPFLGVGETLAIFMVFVYAFLPILKNTYTGHLRHFPRFHGSGPGHRPDPDAAAAPGGAAHGPCRTSCPASASPR